jgi:hypothetical protein
MPALGDSLCQVGGKGGYWQPCLLLGTHFVRVGVGGSLTAMTALGDLLCQGGGKGGLLKAMTALGDSLCQDGGRGVTDNHDCSWGLTLSGWG